MLPSFVSSLRLRTMCKFAASGLVLKRATKAEELNRLLRHLKPMDCGIELIRIGGSSDGGYIVPNDLEGVAACFSPGVSDSACFEEDIYSRFSIPSHLADYTVDGPPHNFIPQTFLKKFIGSRNDNEFITLSDWMDLSLGNRSDVDLILQMDIEGAEYEAILSTPMELLEKFRVMVIEIHDFDNWADPNYFMLVQSFFLKILQKFTVVHAHANNCCGVVSISGVKFPRVFELSLIRNDRIKSINGYAKFPNPLDASNLSNKPEIEISDFFPTGTLS